MIGLLIAWLSIAQADDCAFQVERFDSIQVQRMRYGSKKECMILVKDQSIKTSWRSFSFFESGMFMVFYSFGDGDSNSDTAARSYYLFPRKQIPTFKSFPGQLLVTDASGRNFYFDTQNATLIAIDDVTFHQSDSVKKANQGGFKIVEAKGTVLSNGFKFGELPYINESEHSEILSTGCFIQNSKLFKYVYGRNPDGSKNIQDIAFKLSDSKFQDLVDKTCSR